MNDQENDGEEMQAKELFAEFHEREPEEGEIAFVDFTDVILPIGPLYSIAYIKEVDGKEEIFYHEFNADSRPVLCSNSDGTQLHILAGEYELTERGIVG